MTPLVFDQKGRAQLPPEFDHWYPPAPVFDQRPGALEATRAVGRLSAVGMNTPEGWRVALHDGAGPVALLTPEDASALAAELGTLAATMHALLTTGEMP